MRGKAQPITAAQLYFIELVAAGASQREAYRQAYPGNKSKPENLDVTACRLAKQPKIAAAIRQASAKVAAKVAEAAGFTREQALREAHQALEMAQRLAKPNAMVQAVVAKSRIAGFLRDDPIVPETPLSLRSEDELKRRAFELGVKLGMEVAERNGRVVATQPKAQPAPPKRPAIEASVIKIGRA